MITSFWYSVFWPYFQFVVFVAFIIYFARKPINKSLESKRDEFRTKLSEAHEALTLAQRKIKKYEAQLESLTKDVEDIKKQHLQEATFEKEKILQEANSGAESILADAKRAAQELIMQSQQELKAEMFELALAEFKKQLTNERLSKIETTFQKEVAASIPAARPWLDRQGSSDTLPLKSQATGQ